MKEIDHIPQQRIHSLLSTCMSLNNFTRAKSLFNEYRDRIDVMYGDGRYFLFSVKYQNLVMLEALFKLFEETKIEEDSLSIKSRFARHELREVLRDAIGQLGSTEEIDKLISKHLPSLQEEEEDYEQDLTGFEEELGELVQHVDEHHDNYDESYQSKAIIGQDIPHEVF